MFSSHIMSDFDVMPTVDFNINKQMYYIISWEYLVQGSSGSMKKKTKALFMHVYLQLLTFSHNNK